MKSRLELPDVDRLSEEQKAVRASILATRGNLDGPFLAWMHSPVMASHAEQLGSFCRYQTVFSTIESELLILCVAAHFSCLGEQQIHEPIALRAGLSGAIIAQIRAGSLLPLQDQRLQLIHALCMELLRGNRISVDSYSTGLAAFGERGMVELVGIVGYYSFVAMTLNAFDMYME